MKGSDGHISNRIAKDGSIISSEAPVNPTIQEHVEALTEAEKALYFQMENATTRKTKSRMRHSKVSNKLKALSLAKENPTINRLASMAEHQATKDKLNKFNPEADPETFKQPGVFTYPVDPENIPARTGRGPDRGISAIDPAYCKIKDTRISHRKGAKVKFDEQSILEQKQIIADISNKPVPVKSSFLIQARTLLNRITQLHKDATINPEKTPAPIEPQQITRKKNLITSIFKR